MSKQIFAYILALFIFTNVSGGENPFPNWAGTPFEIYKNIEDTDLKIYHLEPSQKNRFNQYTVLAFFGGGWVSGSPEGSYAKKYANMGFRVFAPEYRIKKYFKESNPKKSADDAVDAYEWLLTNAKKLKIDPKKIIITGFSAGGHLAAIVPIKTKSKIKPALITLYSAVTDVSENGYQGSFKKDLSTDWEPYSPFHNLKKDYPPTILFAGKKDTIVKHELAIEYDKKLKSLNVHSELYLYDDYGHGLGADAFKKTSEALESFLK